MKMRLQPLPADSLVYIRCGPDCYPALAAALERLCAEWSEDPASRRRRDVFSKLSNEIDRILAAYQDELIAKGYKRRKRHLPVFSRYYDRFGRLHTDRKLRWFHRILRRPLEVARRIEGRGPERVPQPFTPTLQVTLEVLDTLDALRSLINLVATFRPKAKYINKVDTRTPWWNPVCRFCQQPTEMEAFKAGDIEWPKLKENAQKKGPRYVLSPTLCREHRSRGKGGKSSSVYRNLRRREPLFRRELEELRWASARKGPRDFSAEGKLLYEFRRRIVLKKRLFILDDAELEQEARALVQLGMTDRNKLIVILLCEKLSVSGIAERLGITRQGVYKAIQGVPIRYRFDRRRPKRKQLSFSPPGSHPPFDGIKPVD